MHKPHQWKRVLSNILTRHEMKSRAVVFYSIRIKLAYFRRWKSALQDQRHHIPEGTNRETQSICDEDSDYEKKPIQQSKSNVGSYDIARMSDLDSMSMCHSIISSSETYIPNCESDIDSNMLRKVISFHVRRDMELQRRSFVTWRRALAKKKIRNRLSIFKKDLETRRRHMLATIALHALRSYSLLRKEKNEKYAFADRIRRKRGMTKT